MAGQVFDRAAEDVGNTVGLEHVNMVIGDQSTATTFYVSGLGLTRDPYLMVHTDNMWINCGQEQFHLPTTSPTRGAPQVLRGLTGLVIADHEALPERLASVGGKLAGTAFAYSVIIDEQGGASSARPPDV